MTSSLRLPVVLPAAGLITIGLFLAMRQLIWVDEAPVRAAPPAPALVINHVVEIIDPVRTLRPEDIERVDPPPPPDIVVDRATPGEDVIATTYSLPEIETPTVERGGPIIRPEQYATPVVRVPPVYPQRLAAAGVEGYCTAQFDVAPNGTIANVQILTCSHNGFASATQRAVSQWRYDPAIENGQPRWMRGLTVRLDYRLDA